ncbi:MAG: helicase-related protein [candidate division WOR-3 bacterium]
MKRLVKALFDKYKSLTKDDESVIIFVYKKEIGWEFLRYVYELGYNIINKTLPFKVEYNHDIEVYDFGFHNSDIPFEEKEEIENAFRNGKLKCLIATQTLAYGVNLPADRVIILLTSFYDRENEKIKIIPSIIDIIQMEGRAGRFGIKEIGYVNILRHRTSEKTYNKVYEEAFSNSTTELYENLKNFKNQLKNYLGESATLSSFILSAYKTSNGNIFEFLNKTFSFKNFDDKRKINIILDFLFEKGYIENNKVTIKGEFCLSTGIPPTAYEEFLRRIRIDGDIFVKIRPLIYTKKIKDCLSPFIKDEDYAKFYDEKYIRILRPFDFPKDGSHELIFYVNGGLFKIENIHNPPSELYLNTEVLHLSKAIIRISDYFFISNEDILRIAHSLNYGLDYNFSPLGSIEGIGHIRANAIKNVILLNTKLKRIEFENKVADILDLIDEKSLSEVLSIRYSFKDNIKREVKNILNTLSRQKDKILVSERILRAASIFKLNKHEALRLPLYELLLKFRTS